jgi:hypothetical protein
MLSRFISEMICDNGGDVKLATFAAVAGVFPGFTVPSTVTPALLSAAWSAPAVYSAGSGITSEYRNGLLPAPIDPLTLMAPSFP